MRVADRITDWAKSLTGASRRGDLTGYEAKLEAVNSLGPQFRRHSDSQLRDQVDYLQKRIRGGDSLEQLLVEAFALIREVSARSIGLRPYDVQIIASIGLFEGKVVEMQTGEGKTLAAVSPVCLNALQGRGVHVLTFNDYLAGRDAEWMGPIYKFLGLNVGFIKQGMGREERKKAYEADVTYLAAKEAGFDFLRDELAYEIGDLVHRPLHMAVVDEADSILIDEARIPLVIAGGTEHQRGRQVLVRDVVTQYEAGIHYTIDENGRNANLTEAGTDLTEQLLEIEDLYSGSNLQLLTELNLALHARLLMKRDVDYIVRQGRVEIVDVYTGRVMEDRHWPYGLQTAIEVKEGLQPSKDAHVLGSITIQHFLSQYPSLCGMSATAESAADELYKFYELEVLTVPSNRPLARIDHPDRVFVNQEDKQRALISEIESCSRSGRPVLVGTLSVEESENLAADLERSGITCNVLNAWRDDQEARIVAEAGEISAVTISTNMAGRGTDIRLGGQSGGGYEEVKSLGGLYVLGTNRHDSLRIDYQLRGRAGRQGDPGSSCFFVSLEDDLMVRNGIGDLLPRKWRSSPNREAVNNPVVRRSIIRAQRIEEGQNFDIRQTLWRFSRVVEIQRRIISKRRRQVLSREVSVSALEKHIETAREQAQLVLGESALQDIERRLMLLSIDECWSKHLERVSNLQDGIHLTKVGGLDPLMEFQKQATASFEETLLLIDERVVEMFTALEITSGENDLDRMGLRGPSSTWTYLVVDDAQTDHLASTLISQRHIGFAANAALLAPVLMVYFLGQRLLRRWRSQ